MKEIKQIPVNSYVKRMVVRSVWFLARDVEKCLKAVYDPVSEFRYNCETRLRLPPGTLVEQFEHPSPVSRGPWVVNRWSGDDYLLELPNRSKFKRWHDSDFKYDILYVYPQNVRRVR